MIRALGPLSNIKGDPLSNLDSLDAFIFSLTTSSKRHDLQSNSLALATEQNSRI